MSGVDYLVENRHVKRQRRRTRLNGHYNGPIRCELLDDGVNLKLLSELVYTSPQGTAYVAPQGSISNGASIPWPVWPIIGSPLRGKYRKAAVMHDRLCDDRKLPHETVHHMFYYQLLAVGTAYWRAWLMWWAVAWFGPRWEIESEEVNADE